MRKANGLRLPIVLHDGAVLDGWHRQRVCVQTGSPARYEAFTGDDTSARRFVVSANLIRRHLDTSQRAMIAALFAQMPHGGDRKGNQERKSALDLSVDEAAELLNVRKDVVKDARVVLASASPEVIAKVQAGELSVSKAAKETREAKPKPAALPKAAPGRMRLTESR